MRSLSASRMSTVVALVAGASVLATGPSYAMVGTSGGHTDKTAAVPDKDPGNSGNAPGKDHDKPGKTPGKPGNNGDKPGDKPGGTGGKGDDHGGKPGESGNKPGDTGNNPGNVDDNDGKPGNNAPEDPEGLFGFCPPVRDINFSWEGGHLNYPLVGGVVEGMSDVGIDPLCVNVDYPNPMSPGNPPPSGPPAQPRGPEGGPPKFRDMQWEHPAFPPPTILPAPASRTSRPTPRPHPFSVQPQERTNSANPVSDLFSGATATRGGNAGTGNGTPVDSESSLGGIL